MEVVHILIKTQHGKLKIVSSKLKDYEEVEELYEVFGRYDIVLKLLVEDKEELKRFIQNKVLILEGILSTETLVSF